MALRLKWSQNEDEVLLRHVKNNPQNLQSAFALASEELGRSTLACTQRWYKVVSRKEDKGNTCFLTVSKNKVGRNRKNCTDDIPEPKLSKWRRILNILFE